MAEDLQLEVKLLLLLEEVVLAFLPLQVAVVLQQPLEGVLVLQQAMEAVEGLLQVAWQLEVLVLEAFVEVAQLEEKVLEQVLPQLLVPVHFLLLLLVVRALAIRHREGR